MSVVSRQQKPCPSAVGGHEGNGDRRMKNVPRKFGLRPSPNPSRNQQDTEICRPAAYRGPLRHSIAGSIPARAVCPASLASWSRAGAPHNRVWEGVLFPP